MGVRGQMGTDEVTDSQARCWADMPALIAGVQAIADEIGLPFIAAQADLGDPEPMADRDGTPYAETSFRWIEPDYPYLRNRKRAVHVAFLPAPRLVAEPVLYRRPDEGTLGTMCVITCSHQW